MSSTIVPTVGLFRTERHAYSWNGGPLMPGVTSAIDPADDKEGLIRWAKQEVAACSLRNFDFLTDLIARGGIENATKWLVGIPDFQRDTAADLGSAVHRLAEQISRGGAPDVTPEQALFAQGYRNFLSDYEPVYESLEQMVCNLTVGFGGTYDAIASVNGERLLIDIKTSRTLQPKIALQLAAYASAEFVGRPNDPKQYGRSRFGIARFDGFAVLHIRPEQYARGYRLVRFNVTDADFDAFQHALALYRWRRRKDVIGESIPRPRIEVPA